MLKNQAIHIADALKILSDRQPHTLRLWKLSTGDILTYKQVLYLGEWRRAGLHRVKFTESGEVRAFRDVSLFEIDGLEVYL